MKCNHCHCHLPEFKLFQKKVCPNCGNPVSTVSATPTKPVKQARPAPQNERTVQGAAASKCMDLAIWYALAAFLLFSVFMICALADNALGINLAVLGSISLVFGSSTVIVSIVFFMIFLRRKHILAQQLQTASPAHKKYLLENAGCPTVGRYIGALISVFFTVLMLVIFFTGVIQKAQYNNNKDRFVSVTATIDSITESEDADGDVDHTVYISYTYNGIEYDTTYSKYSSSMEEGDTLSVLIDPENPGELPNSGTVAIVMGLIFLALSCIPLWFGVLRPLLRRRKA